MDTNLLLDAIIEQTLALHSVGIDFLHLFICPMEEFSSISVTHSVLNQLFYTNTDCKTGGLI